jgi:cell division protein FtsB
MMGATEMEQVTTPAETSTPEAYSPPPAVRPTRSAWAPLVQSRERRWWTVALAATLLVAATGLGILYADDSANQATIRSLTTQNESLTGRNQILNDQLNTTKTNLTATLGELAQTKAELDHPTLTTWSLTQVINGSDWYLASAVPDAFTLHLKATSTGSMSVSILTFSEWAAAINCIDSGRGNTNWCMHHSGAVVSWLGVTSVNYDFHLAEGCSGYVAVITAPTKVTIRPNVSVTYNPSSTATGACA